MRKSAYALLVGGMPPGPQERALRSGVSLIIATPGRFLDHMQREPTPFRKHAHAGPGRSRPECWTWASCPTCAASSRVCRADEQTLMFSATMPPVIQKLAGEILRKPKTIDIGRRSTPAIGITQAAYPVAEHLKTTLLRYLLRHTEMPSVLVFTRTKGIAKRLKRSIEADGFTVAELHSNRTQAQRKKAMDGFRRGDFQVLVATNIAARGIDVEHITHVISVDVPHVPDDYVHRIGRTGRAKAEGDAFIMVSPRGRKKPRGHRAPNRPTPPSRDPARLRLQATRTEASRTAVPAATTAREAEGPRARRKAKQAKTVMGGWGGRLCAHPSDWQLYAGVSQCFHPSHLSAVEAASSEIPSFERY